MARSRVELFEEIRPDRRTQGLSMRELAERHSVHRRTVRQALASPLPPPRTEYPPRKQRHTARRIWQRLVAERDATARRSPSRAMSRAGESLSIGSRSTHTSSKPLPTRIGSAHPRTPHDENEQAEQYLLRQHGFGRLHGRGSAD